MWREIVINVLTNLRFRTDQWRTTWRRFRALSIVVALGLALLTTARPAAAYVIEALTSISADEAADKAALEKAIRAAVDDIATHAVAFTPTVVSLREAKLVGDRIYLFVLIADAGRGSGDRGPEGRFGAAEPGPALRRHGHSEPASPASLRDRSIAC